MELNISNKAEDTQENSPTAASGKSRRDAMVKLGTYTAGGAAMAFFASRTAAQPNCSSMGIANSTGNNNNANGCN